MRETDMDDTVRVLDACLIPYGNSPTRDEHGKPVGRVPSNWKLDLLLDRLPGRESRRYSVRKYPTGETLYVSVLDGVADFFLHDRRDEKGYGGAVVTGYLEDGRQFSVKGPWSSSCATVNALGKYPYLLPAAATTSKKDWDRGYTFYALSGVTMEVVEQAVKLLPGWTFNRERQLGPAILGLSDEQINAVVGGREFQQWTYQGGIPACETCKGVAVLPAAGGEQGAWPVDYRDRAGEWKKCCPDCAGVTGGSMYAGSAAVTGTRRNGRIVR